MRTRSVLSLLLAVAAVTVGALLGPLPAQAAPTTCVAPPGTSGIDQYCETVPGAGGDQGTRGGGGGTTGGHHTLRSSLPKRTVSQLGQTTAGRAILGLSTGSTNASTTSASGGSGSGSGGGSGKTGGASHHGSSSAASQSGAPTGRYG